MAYIKPQSPLKLGEDHIYPLTTYDQILMSDGSRWDGKTAEASSTLPTPTVNDVGKILRVNAEGKYELVLLLNAEEATF